MCCDCPFQHVRCGGIHTGDWIADVGVSDVPHAQRHVLFGWQLVSERKRAGKTLCAASGRRLSGMGNVCDAGQCADRKRFAGHSDRQLMLFELFVCAVYFVCVFSGAARVYPRGTTERTGVSGRVRRAARRRISVCPKSDRLGARGGLCADGLRVSRRVCRRMVSAHGISDAQAAADFLSARCGLRDFGISRSVGL